MNKEARLVEGVIIRNWIRQLKAKSASPIFITWKGRWNASKDLVKWFASIGTVELPLENNQLIKQTKKILDVDEIYR